MKTEPMKQQVAARERLRAAPDYFALGAEQGTGKTWMLLDDIEHQFRAGRINAALIIAPKGVHTGWVVREIPRHMSEPVTAEFWLSGAGKRRADRLERLISSDLDGLRIVAMNVDAINTKAGFAFAKRFLKRHKVMMIIDESQRIKNPGAARTKKAVALGELAVSRRIASGTLVADGPLDLFGQFEFLRPGLLGTTSHRAFVAEYAELLPSAHPLMQGIAARSRHGANAQVIARDENGAPVYRNIQKLQQLIAPHTFRVTKANCLDLPEKIYQTHYFELGKLQREFYETLKSDLRLTRPDGEIDTFTALTIINKLRQVTSGFILVDGQPARLRLADCRMSALKECIEDVDGPVIIWASFREELAQIAEAMRHRSPVCYHGATSVADREAAVDAFQTGQAKTFIANPAAGGVGLTLTAAEVVVYYSNAFSLEERVQSEDRAHRIGTRHPVVYIDLVARDSIDERIAVALQTKKLVAAEVLDGVF